MALRHVDSAAASKCNGFRLESLQAGHLEKNSVYWRGAQYVNVQGSVQWEGVYSVKECRLGVQIFFS